MLLCRRAFVLQVWQVAYIVLARQAWKHYGEGMIPSLKLHYEGLTELIDWFDRHADPKDGANHFALHKRRVLRTTFTVDSSTSSHRQRHAHGGGAI